MMTAMTPQVLNEFLQNQWGTHTIMENIVQSVPGIPSEIVRFNDVIDEHPERIVHMEDIMHMMTNKALGNLAFLALVARFMKCNNEKELGELKASTTPNEVIESCSGNNGRLPVAVSPQQNSASASLPLLNTSLDVIFSGCQARCKRNLKKCRSHSSTDERCERNIIKTSGRRNIPVI